MLLSQCLDKQDFENPYVGEYLDGCPMESQGGIVARGFRKVVNDMDIYPQSNHLAIISGYFESMIDLMGGGGGQEKRTDG